MEVDHQPETEGLDLTFLECIEHVEAIMEADIEEEEQTIMMDQVESSLPGCNVNDLMWWPNAWFNDEKMKEVDLSSREIVEYLMAYTGKRLVGAEERALPQLPSSMDGMPPAVIKK